MNKLIKSIRFNSQNKLTQSWEKKQFFMMKKQYGLCFFTKVYFNKILIFGRCNTWRAINM